MRRRGTIVIGADEVGRGCLSGECWAVCVGFPEGNIPDGIGDSKALTAKRREALAIQIREVGIIGIGRVSVEEIDRINILNAAMLAMKRAFDALPKGKYTVLVDGNRSPDFGVKSTPVIGGDAIHPEIGAASIVAKVERDRYMNELHGEFPHYDWNNNKGYGTPAHLAGIQLHGPSPHHRMTFAPLRQGSLAF